MRRRSSMQPLDPVLRHVEEELSASLTQACRHQPVEEETTGELERLSDVLLEASQQARAAARLRRRMRASDVPSQLRDRLTPPTGVPRFDAPRADAPPQGRPDAHRPMDEDQKG